MSKVQERNRLIIEDLIRCCLSTSDIAHKHSVSVATVSIIKRKHDIGIQHHMNFTEIGEELGVSRDIVRRTYNEAMSKIRAIVKNEGFEWEFD